MSSMTKQKIKAHKTMVAFMGGLIMLVTSNIAMAALSQNYQMPTDMLPPIKLKLW